MEEVFQQFSEFVALTLEAISILMVALGGIEAAYKSLRPLLGGAASHGIRREAWLSLAAE